MEKRFTAMSGSLFMMLKSRYILSNKKNYAKTKIRRICTARKNRNLDFPRLSWYYIDKRCLITIGLRIL